jgi:hypothetical protein
MDLKSLLWYGVLTSITAASQEQAEDDPAAGHEGGVRPMSGSATRRMPTAIHKLGAKPATHAAVRKPVVKKVEEHKDMADVAAGKNGMERRLKEDDFEVF